MYTNNEIISHNNIEVSRDTARQKSQEKFLATDRTGSLTHRQQECIKRVKSQRVLKELNSGSKDKGISICVKKWIDYSSKYGIGYCLSNRFFGVYFNDSTKMVACNPKSFVYIEKQEKEDIFRKHEFNNYPLELKKKVSLFNHFKGYLEG